jgi:ribosomal peptide maturation radical SAM protein 1
VATSTIRDSEAPPGTHPRGRARSPAGARRAQRVLLVTMPFGALGRPALGLSILKPIVRAAGHACAIRYLNVAFAEFTGLATYERIHDGFPHIVFAGEWVFAESLNGPDPARDRRYLDGVLRGQWRVDEGRIGALLAARRLALPFLEHCLAAIDWDAVDVVGFTSTFEQTVASLALARRLKAHWPRLVTVFGGANFEGEMGVELHRTHSFIDAICSGEAEESFPRLLAALGAGGPPGAIPGVLHRLGGRGAAGPPAPPISDLDAYPAPDFADFAAALERSAVGAGVVPTWLLETSRGCWWGVKSHCTFCGLNGSSMGFRSKSSARVLAEIDRLIAEHDAVLIETVDNILDMAYFRDLLPALAARGAPVELFYEVKANLSRDQVRVLAEAGVRRIQPGLESLSDRLLARMRKGTTALRNVQLLKYCRQYGVSVDWNLLYGFPGETTADYAPLLDWLPAIRFLGPPGACGPLRLDRFSPYFTDPGAHGLKDLRPVPAYACLFPLPEASLARIAYYFDFAYEPSVDPGSAADEARRAADAWRASPDPGALMARPLDSGRLRLHDTRRALGAQRTIELEATEALAYAWCDSIRSAASVANRLAATFPNLDPAPAAVEACLHSFVANRLMLSDGRHFLALALDLPAADNAAGAKSAAQEALAERVC